MPELIKISGAGEQHSPSVRSEVRAVLDTSGLGSALLTGSRVLACRCWDQAARGWRWLRGDLPFRGGATLVVTWTATTAARTHLHAVAFAAAAGVVVWVAAAWMHAPTPRPAATATAADDPAPAPPGLAAVADLARRVAEDRQGAHLAQLIDTGELAPWTQPELKAALLDWDVPVEEFKLRLGGRQRVRDGVRLRDLPAAPPAPDPEPAAEAPADASPEPDPAPALEAR